MTDGQRLDFLAAPMDASVRLHVAPDLIKPMERQGLDQASRAIFNAYKVHRHDCDTPTAFRLAIEDAAKAKA